MDPDDVDGNTRRIFHATHVTGTISAKGVSISALGMAPNVNVKSYHWNSALTEMVSAANDAVSPILISNSSYGIPINHSGGT